MGLSAHVQGSRYPQPDRSSNENHHSEELEKQTGLQTARHHPQMFNQEKESKNASQQPIIAIEQLQDMSSALTTSQLLGLVPSILDLIRIYRSDDGKFSEDSRSYLGGCESSLLRSKEEVERHEYSRLLEEIKECYLVEGKPGQLRKFSLMIP